MSSVEVMAADAQAPMINTAAATPPERTHIAVIAVTTSSAETDLSLTAQLGDDTDGFYWTFQADGGDVYIALAEVTGGTVDETATTGDTRCAKINNGERVDWRINKRKFLVVKGSVACNLRITQSSLIR